MEASKNPVVFVVGSVGLLVAGVVGLVLLANPPNDAESTHPTAIVERKIEELNRRESDLLAAINKLDMAQRPAYSANSPVYETASPAITAYKSASGSLVCYYSSLATVADRDAAEHVFEAATEGRGDEALAGLPSITDEEYRDHIFAYHLVPYLQEVSHLKRGKEYATGLKGSASKQDALASIAVSLASLKDYIDANEAIRLAGKTLEELREAVLPVPGPVPLPDTNVPPAPLPDANVPTPRPLIPKAPEQELAPAPRWPIPDTYPPSRQDAPTPIDSQPITQQSKPAPPVTLNVVAPTPPEPLWRQIGFWVLSVLLAAGAILAKPGWEAAGKMWAFQRFSKHFGDDFRKAIGL